MEVRVGEWHLCEEYIDEPVQIRTVEPKRIEVRYLCSGKMKWLGFPKIWQACKPHAIPFQLQYDPAARSITLLMADENEPSRQLTLAQLRAGYLPRPTAPKPRRAPEPSHAPVRDRGLSGWSDEETLGEAADYQLESED